MRFLIVGAGALGCYVGGRLAVDGNEVVFMDRDPVRAVLGTCGLRVETTAGALIVEAPHLFVAPESAGFFDVVVVCVRVADTESVIEEVRPVLSSDCAVISLQSGVDAMYRLRDALGDRYVMPGFARVALESHSPAVVQELDPAPSVNVGEFDGSGSWRLECVHAAFESAGFKASTGMNMLVDLWRHYLLDAALASMAAQSGLSIQRLLTEPEYRARLTELLAEAITIATTQGIPLDDTPEALIASVEAGSGEIWLHMQRDLAAGRPIENGALAGSLLVRAKKLGLAAPAWVRLHANLEKHAPSLDPGRDSSLPPVRVR